MLIVTLLILSALLCGVGAIIHRYTDGCPPVPLAIAYMVGVILVLGVVAIPTALRLSTGFDAIVYVSLVVTISFPPVTIMGMQVAHTAGDVIAGWLYDSSMVSPPPNAYGRAGTCAVAGDMPGALREYRKYFDANPRVPTPLFAAALYLEQKKEYGIAACFYREIIEKFEANKPIWAEGCLRLAALSARHLNDPRTSDALLHQVMRRARNLKQAKAAAEQVMRRYSGERDDLVL